VVVDHVFICTDFGAPEAERLVAFGLLEGPPNSHPGQGTANRRFFFRSTMLELLWVSDPAEARGPLAERTRLWERWSRRRDGACPFGLIVRPADNSAGAPVPFAAWEYEPSYLPPPLVMHIASEAALAEPMWVYMSFLEKPSREIAHAAGLREITSVRLTSPAAGLHVTQAMASAGVIGLISGTEHRMELEFDGGTQGAGADFRPHLPLVFRW
jgi:hypothetical protein